MSISSEQVYHPLLPINSVCNEIPQTASFLDPDVIQGSLYLGRTSSTFPERKSYAGVNSLFSKHLDFKLCVFHNKSNINLCVSKIIYSIKYDNFTNEI